MKKHTVHDQKSNNIRLEPYVKYDVELALNVYMLHKRIGDKFALNNPYYAFTETQEKMAYEIHLDDNILMRVGPIGAFTHHDIAMFVHEQASIYLQRGAMGPQEPFNHPAIAERYMAELINGFHANQLLVQIVLTNAKTMSVLAGVSLVTDTDLNNEAQIVDVLFARSSSSLPTLSSLRIKTTMRELISPEMRKFIDQYGKKTKNSLACPTRLFCQLPETLENLKVNIKELSWHAMAGLALSSISYSLINSNQPPLVLLFDTHDERIRNKLCALFKFKTLTSEVECTDNIKNSILFYHYSSYIEKIHIGYVDIKKYFVYACRYLLNYDVELDVQSKDYLISALGGILSMHDLAEICKGFQLNKEYIKRMLSFVSYKNREKLVFSRSFDVLSNQNNLDLVRAGLFSDGFKQPNFKPYRKTEKEFENLAQALSIFPVNRQQMLEKIVNGVRMAGLDIKESEIHFLFEDSFIVDDMAYLAAKCQKLKKEGGYKQSKYWLYDEKNKSLTQLIGPKVYQLLLMSRYLGLIPYKLIREMSHLKITVVGASACAMTIDLLSLLGAVNITVLDDGKITASNIPRFPGLMGDSRKIGRYKVEALIELLYSRNPYGNFQGIPGRLVPDNDSRRSSNDMTYDEICSDSDLIIECIDDLEIKLGFRAFLEIKYKEKPAEEKPLLLFLADTSIPFSGIENPNEENHFNQGLTSENIQNLTNYLIKNEANPKKAASVVLTSMLGENLPFDHKLQLLLYGIDIAPFWAQSPISAHGLAGVACKVVLGKHSYPAKEILSKNFTPFNVPSIFYNLNPNKVDILNSIIDKLSLSISDTGKCSVKTQP